MVTTFENPWYYIVRFDVGDLARIDETGQCSCGRNEGLILSAIEGRSKDVTLTCEGRVVTLRELDNALNILKDIDEYKLGQISGGRYLLHIVSRQKDERSLGKKAEEVLSKLYGTEAEISIVFDEAIPPTASGKYRLARF